MNWLRSLFAGPVEKKQRRCRHAWRETGGAFCGAEKVCPKCGLWDAMSGLYYGYDTVRSDEERKEHG